MNQQEGKLNAVEQAQAETFPPGLNNVYLFGIFNAFSFQMILGSPMVLYAKTLGASATVLGIIAGMMPLLVIFQIPAAKHVSRVGFRRFVLAGWSARVGFIFLMALVPLTGLFLLPSAQLSLLLFLLFAFNLSRGISSCAWLPWITSLIPAKLRGRYLVRESAYINLASFGAFLLAALCLGNDPRPWQFAALFAFSAVNGLVSLSFIKRIPEGETVEAVRTSTTPVPWSAIAGYPPFRKLLWMNLAWSIASGGISTFTVVFLKVMVGMPEGQILFLTSAAFIGGLCSLWVLGTRLDHVGSKPVMTMAILGWLVILAGWFLLAAKIMAPRLGFVLFLQFLMGLAGSLFGLANTRLAMATVPVMGRNHFFALYSVVGSLALGSAPIFWGMMIDAFRWLEMDWRGLEINRYTLFFTAAAVVFAVTLALCRRLDEPEAASMERLMRDILMQSPLRIWFRFWPRG